MISTALAIREATRDAVHDKEVMGMASAIFHHRHELDEEDFIKAMYMYSGYLSAMTATLVTHACLTKTQLRDMLDTIEEMEEMGKDIE
jgi:transcriptional regulator of NAD metabolism